MGTVGRMERSVGCGWPAHLDSDDIRSLDDRTATRNNDGGKTGSFEVNTRRFGPKARWKRPDDDNFAIEEFIDDARAKRQLRGFMHGALV